MIPPQVFRSLRPALAAVGLLACGDPAAPADAVRISAVSPDAYGTSYWAANSDRSFAVGVTSELVVGSDYVDAKLQALACSDGSCSVETVPDDADLTRQRFLVTPKAAKFTATITFAGTQSAVTTITRTLDAVDGTMHALHRGAGPGVPFLAGMHVVWYVGTREHHVAWDATRSKVEVTPPFTLVGEPIFNDGPDDDSFARLEIAAPSDVDGVLQGAVTFMSGTSLTSFPLTAVSPREVKRLRIAALPEDALLNPPDVPLSTVAADLIDLANYQARDAWVVFQTRDGLLGLAGGGESLPARDATFHLVPYYPAFFGFELDGETVAPTDQPTITLTSAGGGISKLTLVVGPLRNTVDVLEGGTP